MSPYSLRIALARGAAPREDSRSLAGLNDTGQDEFFMAGLDRDGKPNLRFFVAVRRTVSSKSHRNLCSRSHEVKNIFPRGQ